LLRQICIIAKDYELILVLYGLHGWHVSETGKTYYGLNEMS